MHMFSFHYFMLLILHSGMLGYVPQNSLENKFLYFIYIVNIRAPQNLIHDISKKLQAIDRIMEFEILYN